MGLVSATLKPLVDIIKMKLSIFYINQLLENDIDRQNATQVHVPTSSKVDKKSVYRSHEDYC